MASPLAAAQPHSRPTNNQLLYKAHFRWKHYTAPLSEDCSLPVATEPCASVTSAFLQILATIHNVEACRVTNPRNILRILSTNTRRTKVVEMSTGTHRVADDLRRHSLSDGQGGHYGTNLDRNRYGSDNNYLFTVTKYNLESLGLCPCLVDIEIVDTRNGNESNVVSVGTNACNCEDPSRVALQDSTALVLGGDASKKRKISEKKKMMKKSASFNSGSELFDALLMAAADDNEGGEIVSNAHNREAPPPPSSAQRQQRSGRKKRGSFNNFFDSFEHDANASGDKKAPFIRRNSVSMILNNPVLAQTGAGDSLLLLPDNDNDDNFQSMKHTSSAANLARLAETQDKRLVSEVRSLREERHKLELALEESKSAQKQAERLAEEAREAARRAADVADSLLKAAEVSGVKLDEHLVETSKYLPTSEQEIGLLKAEIADLKTRVFDPRKAMNMLSQMPMMNPMMMGLGGMNGGMNGGMGGGLNYGPNYSMNGLNPLGGMQKVASMPNFLAGMNSADQKRSNLVAADGAIAPGVPGAGLASGGLASGGLASGGLASGGLASGACASGK